MGESIKTVEEFIDWTIQRKGGLFVYRGIPKAAWGVESSAYRRIHQSRETLPPPPVLQSSIEHLLESAKRRGFQEYEGKRYSDLQLLGNLQHQGAATCLIDFTTNALIALWFACEDRPHQPAGKVVAMATEDTDRFSIVTSQDIEKPICTFLDKDKLWKWEPSHLNPRIAVQQSVFVFGTGTIDETLYESIQIDRGSKGQIREVLEERFGITEQYLFSDFPGFALSHGHDRPYLHYTADDYFFLGVTAQQKGVYEEAKEFYGRVLEIAPDYPEAGSNLETVKQLLAQIKAKREAEGKDLEQFMTMVKALNTRMQQIAASEGFKAFATGVEALNTRMQQIAASEEFKAFATGMQRIAASEGFKAYATGMQRIAASEELKALATERLD